MGARRESRSFVFRRFDRQAWRANIMTSKQKEQTVDKAIAAKGYAHPEVLVTTQWVADHLNDPSIRVVESNEDILLYDQGHVPGAIQIDWVGDLNDKVRR